MSDPMIPESAEVRSDQPAPSARELIHDGECDPRDPPSWHKHPATPSLREALERLDGAFQWIREEYPKALVAMPREHYKAFANARAALASSDPGSPSDGGLDSQTRDLLEACHERNIHSRGDMGYWLNLDSGGDPPPLGSTAAHGERP